MIQYIRLPGSSVWHIKSEWSHLTLCQISYVPGKELRKQGDEPGIPCAICWRMQRLKNLERRFM